MLDIQTFDAVKGGNVLYKALAHPLAAEAVDRLAARLADAGPVGLFDPDSVAPPLLTMYPALPVDSLFVQDVRQVGETRAGLVAQPMTEIATSGIRTLLVAGFRTHGQPAARLHAREHRDPQPRRSENPGGAAHQYPPLSRSAQFRR
jgi:hypothetical protein